MNDTISNDWNDWLGNPSLILNEKNFTWLPVDCLSLFDRML